MITFWILISLLVIVTLAVLLRPFFFKSKHAEIERNQQNVRIARERLEELKADLKNNVLSQSEYNQTREEIELSLLDDIDNNSETDTGLSASENQARIKKNTAWTLLLFIPLFTLSTYIFLGKPELVDASDTQVAGTMPAGHPSTSGKLDSIEEMVAKLAARLKTQPDNAEGWFMLGRSYMSLNMYKEAVAALEKTNQLVPDNPVIMLRYADALTMYQGGQISGKPFELIKRAVALKPDDPTGLWLIGMGYEEQGEYQKAISYWKLLLPLLQDEQSQNEVNSLIAQAKRKAGDNTVEDFKPANTMAENNISTSIKVKVSIDKNSIKNIAATDTVFIFAKAVNGPPMPLAVVRKQVKDLPLEVSLDDSMAMIPSMKLSNFKKVQVLARVSKSGTPQAQSGDLQSEIHMITIGDKEQVVLTINTVLP